MYRSRFILIFIMLITASSVSAAWPGIFKTNRYNSNGLRHGRWVYYWNDTTKVPMNRLRFKNGREFGLNRYYDIHGKVWLKFRAAADGRMKVTYYDDKGRKEKSGRALMIYDPTEIRYCWHGKWKFYENGKLIRMAVFEMGNEKTAETERSGGALKD